ncbi:MAG: hypothetical protein E6I19_12535 [Chloroflexi bacterium]|nr:MAG: hypothetical protein E6I19_12535 [Chloroflexota bacterium]
MNTDAIRALNAIYETTSPGVIVHEVSIGFGRVDVMAWIKTSLDSDTKIEHPTMRLARWVNKVRNLTYVSGTTTTILVHDPGHERRHEKALAREAAATKRRSTRSRAR